MQHNRFKPFNHRLLICMNWHEGGKKSAQLQAHKHFWPKYCKIRMPPMLPLPIVNSSTLGQAVKSSSPHMFWHTSPIMCPKSASKPVHLFPKPAMTMLQKQRENRGSSNHEMDHLVCFTSTRTEKVINRGRAMSSDQGMCEKRNLSSKEDYPDIDDQQFGERFKLPHITDVLDIPPRPSTFCIQSRCMFFNLFSVLSFTCDDQCDIILAWDQRSCSSQGTQNLQ